MKPVTIYTSAMCPYCWRALDLLKKKNVKFEHIKVDMNPKRRAEMVQRAGGRTSVPQIFVGEDHIGGCDEMYALERAGKLDQVLAD
ncbi:MAG TPA: glutaredoxin 3 [Hellea balneolensis]|uniref:Glutaredoxin n=1 Tax=Hellea balneolensis TaxID=287478 RepID=A0A7C5R1H6_9PROT|nr:glutaredoxin 3 [Hellea balneolensis]